MSVVGETKLIMYHLLYHYVDAIQSQYWIQLCYDDDDICLLAGE